jgi:hypothetical protein
MGLIQVDKRDLDRLIKELKLAHRSKYPNTVRFTLSDLAKDAEKVTIPKAFLQQSGYTIRKPNFVKAFVRSQYAKGWDVDTMYSQAGFHDAKATSRGQKNAVSRMKQQDEGGSVKSEGVPLYATRRGKSHKKLIQNKHFWKNIKVVAKVDYGQKSQLIRAVTGTGVKRNGGGLSTPVGVIYGKYLYGIQGYERVMGASGERTMKLHLTRLYDVKDGRMVKLHPKQFIEKGSLETGAKLEQIFIKNAEKQLAKFK